MNKRLLFSGMVCGLLVFRAGAQSGGSPAPAGPTTAPGPSIIKVQGEVQHPLSLSAADLSKMPQATVSSRDKQGKPHDFSGVPVSEILHAAGVTTGKDLRGKNMAKYLLVSCADGYQVVFSLAELDSAFTDRVAILADKEDGMPLTADTGPFRFVIPGEKKPARNCFKVAMLTIGVAKE
jgi:DMSO/TMAO reductase YedYZ molybdopterin-dependent catalytic subunit